MRIYGLLEMRWTVGIKGAKPDVFRGEVDVAIGRKTPKRVRLTSPSGRKLVVSIRSVSLNEFCAETHTGAGWVCMKFEGATFEEPVTVTGRWGKTGFFAPWSGTFWKTGESQ